MRLDLITFDDSSCCCYVQEHNALFRLYDVHYDVLHAEYQVCIEDLKVLHYSRKRSTKGNYMIHPVKRITFLVREDLPGLLSIPREDTGARCTWLKDHWTSFISLVYEEVPVLNGVAYIQAKTEEVELSLKAEDIIGKEEIAYVLGVPEYYVDKVTQSPYSKGGPAKRHKGARLSGMTLD